MENVLFADTMRLQKNPIHRMKRMSISLAPRLFKNQNFPELRIMIIMIIIINNKFCTYHN